MSSAPQLPLLVFSDLDGTLIDHETYSAAAAAPALDMLREKGCGLILASSKTGAEIAQIREDLGWSEWPAIVENGAGVLPAGDGATQDRSVYYRLLVHLNAVPIDLRHHFRGFGDMTRAELARITGLDADAADRAKERAFSEPGIWSGSAEERAQFLAILAEQGITAREGGRFLTLSFGHTKAEQMAALVDRFAPRRTVALGDAPNDTEMLEAADTGIIVLNPNREPLPELAGEKSGQITRTKEAGPKGWNAAMLHLLASLPND